MPHLFRRRFRSEGRPPIKKARPGRPGDGTVHPFLADCAREIRLCRINYPGPFESRDLALRIEFDIARLDECRGSYRCLSYAWGDARDQVAISMNGARYHVTKNLYGHLCRLLALGLGDRIWIDALSINQTDKCEKTQQVDIMGAIYAGAREVLVCICETPSGNDFGLIVTTLDDLAMDLHFRSFECFLPTSSHNAADFARRTLLSLLNAAWFTRTWTIQEICLAQRTLVLFPWGLYSWSTFVKAFVNWNKHRRSCCAEAAESQSCLTEAFHRVSLPISPGIPKIHSTAVERLCLIKRTICLCIY